MDYKKNFSGNVFFAVFFLLSLIWIGYLCFYRLGDAGIHNWDEARHIVNAFEMLKSGNGWIHTYLYETDYYNFKPPFSMWCIALAFRLLGINHFSMRIYSAISMLLIYILLHLFVLKEFGRRAASIFCLIFSFNLNLFFFHMARSADADALYLLMVVIAMICLYETQKQPWFLAGTGFFLSMAFMAKCFHVATGVVIVICYLPVICKKCKLRHYVCAGVCGIIPVGIWATVRFLFDGFAFFAGMLGQEVIDRVEKENDYFAYVRHFADNPVVVLLLIVTVTAILLHIVSCFKQAGGADEKKKWINRITDNKLYLFVIWFLIPLAIYSAGGHLCSGTATFISYRCMS